MILAGRRTNCAAVACLATHAVLLAYTAHSHCPTLNEPGHLVAGMSNWHFGRFDIYRVNPPLVRMMAAVPVMFAGAKTDWTSFYEGPGARPEFTLGEEFVVANGQRSVWLMTLARWACIPFSLLGGYFCYLWARDLYGAVAGLIALALWCFCPSILAHGALITSDAAATALGFAACYTFWRWLKRPTWWHTLLSGAILGLAELTKTTLVVFYPLWPILWLAYRLPDWRSTGTRRLPTLILRELGMLAVRMIIGLYVINLGYGFEGSCTKLGEFLFVSATLGAEGGKDKAPPVGGNRFAKTWLAKLPVPLPKNYVLGIDQQRKDFEKYPQPSYLRGQFQEKGWWYYYLYALAIKVPLGTWVLILLAATRGIWLGKGKRTSDDTTQRLSALSATLAYGPGTMPAILGTTWRDEFILLAPAIIILTFVSSQTGFSEHMRYVLPIFPFFFVWISRVAVVFDPSRCREPSGTEVQAEIQDMSPARLAGPTEDSPTRLAGPTGKRPTGQRIFAGLVIASLAWSIVSSLSVYPHSLSYFNELVGGPTGGPQHLIHSNVDWGQDLLFLKKWIDKHPEAKPLNLAYFGYFDPKYAGIEYTAPEVSQLRDGENPEEASILPGWYAISVNFVQGLPCFSYRGDGTKTSYKLQELARFQRLKPVAMAGYSIYIYHVE